ncbi:acyltransferase [Streptomyces sp. NPDC005892]|uniref:acyltransferase family protein n=1 Tax=Streptomyces sp. NPDC005892 TaxID=3155593 RepID=UPI0033C1EA3C
MADCFQGRNNSLGFIRLILASAVVVSHASVLGFGEKEFGHGFSHGQTDLGKISVYGFFVLSGILVTRSGKRLPPGRFLWHRALRLLPGLWVCLAVTAFVVAPLLYWTQHAGLGGFWDHSRGPFDYLGSNWAVAPLQNDVAGVIAHSRNDGLGHSPSIDAALWSLRYEVFCYFGVALLAVTGALTRARPVVLLVAVVLGCYAIAPALQERFWAGPADSSYALSFEIFPVMGKFDPDVLIYLAFAFAVGAVIESYRRHIPVSDPLGVLALLVFLGTVFFGYFFVVGIPAFAYLLLWLAIRLPGRFRRVGARNDLSYGVYIYGFVVQQTLTALDFARWGFWSYLVMSLAGSLAVAAASWHLVEKPAMRLKDLGRAHTVRTAPQSAQPAPPGEPETAFADAGRDRTLAESGSRTG